MASLFIMPFPSTAGDNLDDVLSGFDDGPKKQDAPVGDGDLGDVLSGFDETESSRIPAKSGDDRVLPDWLTLFGGIGLSSSWNFAHDAPEIEEADFRGLSMLRTTLRLGGDFKFGGWQGRVSGHGFYDSAYAINDRDQYSSELLDEYEQELEFDEVYLLGSLSSNVDMKVGRQIVAWGKSDNIRVTDILNPIDNRMVGLVDVKDLRLPTTMTKLDYYVGDWNISAIMIHEVRLNKNPVYNSDFLPGDTPLPDEVEPSDFSLDNQQYALAVNGIFSGWDLSLYQARVYDARAHLVTDDMGRPLLVHNKVSMSGLSANVAF